MPGDQIFWLESAVRENDRLSDGPGMRFETELCPGDPEHTKRQRRLRPLRLIAPVRPITDFQWSQYDECIVTARVKAVFVEEAVSGVEFRKIETFTTAGDRFATQELYELVVSGWGGMAPASSGVKVIEECPYCDRRVFSRYTNPVRLFDLERWDGSDVFLIWPLPRYILTLGRVKDLIAKNRFTGVRIRSLAELPMNPLIDTLTPGSVADWFDDERAEELSNEVEQCLRK